MKCPICKTGHLISHIESRKVVRNNNLSFVMVCYDICSSCGSEVVDKEQKGNQ
jgi:hypothetical protein